MLSERENYLRNARFQGPQWIPSLVAISDASWDQYRGEMEQVALRHPLFFPHVRPGWRDYDRYEFAAICTAGKPYTDPWGCIWQTAVSGILGAVVNAPLARWEDLDRYRFPDPQCNVDAGPIDWAKVRQNIRRKHDEGQLLQVGPGHGFLFLRLQYLRGFENLMLDMADEDPRLQGLIDKLADFSEAIVRNFLDLPIDVMEFPEDLGTQTASMISPAHFRRWIKPVYRRLMAPCKAKGILVGNHSDGYIMELIPELLDCGVDIINPQDLCNGIDNLVREVKGRACIRLDIDRQSVIPFGSRRDIFNLIEEEVRKLGDPRGGLELICGIYPPTPPANVDALCSALEKYRTFFWK